MQQPLRAAVTGLGGFAYCHHEALRALEVSGEAHLIATCDPFPECFPSQDEKWEFTAREVHFYNDFLEMLDAHQLDLVTLPTPIPLHAPMHRACVERDLPCYLEKPPTLFWGELEEMLEVERGARRATQVGFNYIAEEPRQTLKRRLLAGEFGALKRVGFIGNWPRSTSYFTRAAWAGRLLEGERMVLDSCTGNAMAHFLHNLLFWCGQGELLSWGEVQSVEAELYRAHDIESFDTCFARAQTKEGIEVLVTATHTGDGKAGHREWLECEAATITYYTSHKYEVRWKDDRVEQGETPRGTLLTENLRHYIRYLSGEELRPLTRLMDARPFVHFHNLLFVAAGHIATVAENHLQRTITEGGELIAIQGVETATEELVRSGRLPSEMGILWGQWGGHAFASDLARLETTVHAMQAQTELSLKVWTEEAKGCDDETESSQHQQRRQLSA